MGACDFSSSKFQLMRLVPRVQGTSLGEPLIWGDASHTSMGLLVPWGLMTMGAPGSSGLGRRPGDLHFYEAPGDFS